ncbi:hypothetical protein [Croceibacterium mercuriale]|uniref:hypothetical protein n=1 Tax=Croceibacterium mercuriale TaxID=1572751 RepID=UPI0006920321|nr:hypothetical protein [Croceibacterium mercuriale]
MASHPHPAPHASTSTYTEQPPRHPALGPIPEKCIGIDEIDRIHAPNAFERELKLRAEVAEYRRSVGLDAPAPAAHTPATQRGLSHDAGRGWVPGDRDIGLPDDRLPRISSQQDDMWDPALTEEENDHAWRYTQWREAEARAQVAFAALWPGLEDAATNQLTPERQVQFLSALATNGNVRSACAAVGTSAHTAYKLRRRDPLFARGWAGAQAAARVHVEAVIHDRALNGIEEPVLYRGEVVATRRRYDNRLLLALAGRLDKAAEDPRIAADEAGLDALLAAIAGDAPTRAATPRATWCANAAAKAGAAWEQATDEEEPEDPEIVALQAARLSRAAALVSAKEQAGAEWDKDATALHARVDGLAAPEVKGEPEAGLRPDPGIGKALKAALLHSATPVTPHAVSPARCEPRITRM